LKQRIYYESDEYEDQANPGTFAAIVITRDEDGPHFKFMSGELTILDLAIPACEALAIALQLRKSGRHTLSAAEWTDETPASEALGETHQHIEHTAPVSLEPGMTPYGPREVGPAGGRPLVVSGPYQAPPEVTGRPEPVRVPPGHRYEMPPGLTDSRVRGPEAVRAGPLPQSRRVG
jgi:hypothetical protein